MPRFVPASAPLPGLIVALLMGWAVAGCGLFSSDEAPLPGVYDASEFRVQRIGGAVDDLGQRGADLKMTLISNGRVVEGRLVTGSQAPAEAFTGTYTRNGERVAFAFDDGALSERFRTGTALRDVEWVFYDEDENEGRLVADAEAYVIFLEREGDAPEEEVGAGTNVE